MVLYKFTDLNTFSHDLATNTNNDETSVLACYHGYNGPDTLALGAGDLNDEANWSSVCKNNSSIFGKVQVGWHNLSVNAEMNFASAKNYWGFTDSNGVSVYKYIFRMKESTDEGYIDVNNLATAATLATAEVTPAAENYDPYNIEYKYPVPPSSRVQFNAGVWHIINTETDTEVEVLQPYRSYWVLVQSANEENANGFSACAMTNSVMFAAGEEGEADEEGGETDNPSYLYKSTDSGTTWTKINNTTLNSNGSKIRSIACSDDGRKIILCRSDSNWDAVTGSTYFGAVYISENGGVTWSKPTTLESTLKNSRYDSVAINEDGTTTTVYAVTCGSEANLTDGMIFISRVVDGNGIDNWEEKSLPKNTKPDGIAYDYPNNPDDPDELLQGKDRNYSVAIDTDQNIFVSNFSGNIKCFYYNNGTLEERWSKTTNPTSSIQPYQYTTASLTLSNHADDHDGVSGVQYLAFIQYGRTLLSEEITDISSDPPEDIKFSVTGYSPDRPVVHIYVDEGNLNSPYYRFYSDANQTEQVGDFVFGLDLDINNDYVFHRGVDSEGNPYESHPFYIDVLSSGAKIEDDEFNGSGIIGTETFKLDLSKATSGSNGSNINLYCTNPDPEHQYMFKNQALIGTLTNNMRNLSMTGSKLFGTYEVDNWDAAGTYSSIPYLIEGTITTGFSGADTSEYDISFSGSIGGATGGATGAVGP